MNFEGDLHSWRYLARERLADWKAERERRIKAEQERDEALAGVRVLARENIECHERAASGCGHPNHGNQDHDCTPFLPDAESRPLAPTGAMAARAMLVLAKHGYRPGHTITHEALAAALTEPPARPEGADELNELIGEYLDSTPGVDDKGMADFLASRGVRVVTEEDPR